jgi:hypothetical protein
MDRPTREPDATAVIDGRTWKFYWPSAHPLITIMNWVDWSDPSVRGGTERRRVSLRVIQ